MQDTFVVILSCMQDVFSVFLSFMQDINSILHPDSYRDFNHSILQPFNPSILIESPS